MARSSRLPVRARAHERGWAARSARHGGPGGHRVGEAALGLAGLLVQVPVDDAADARRRRRCGVDQQRTARGAPRRWCGRRRTAGRRCRQRHGARTTTPTPASERRPVLVQRDHGDHHEEVEVRLDVAAGQMHDHRRGQHQAGGTDAAAAPCAAARSATRPAHRARDGRVDQHVSDRQSPQAGVGGDGDRVGDKQDGDGSMPGPPGGLRQGVPPRGSHEPTPDSLDRPSSRFTPPVMS